MGKRYFFLAVFAGLAVAAEGSLAANQGGGGVMIKAKENSKSCRMSTCRMVSITSLAR